jgi:hypothetical protein
MAYGAPRADGRPEPGVLGVVGVVALMWAATVLQAVWLVAGWSSPTHHVHNDGLPQEDAESVVFAALTIACGALVLYARSREFGLCLTCCVGALLVASVPDFRPSTFLGPNGESLQWVLVLSDVCVGAAAAISIGPLRRRTPERAASMTVDIAAVRRRRVLVPALGLPAVTIGVIASFFDTNTLRYGPLSDDWSITCCAVQRLDHWYQVGAIVSDVAVLAFVLLATRTPSRTRATAWLAGPALCGLSGVAFFTAEKLWPAQSIVGLGRTNLLDGGAELTLGIGYWLALLGLAAFGAGALLLPADRTAVNAASA